MGILGNIQSMADRWKSLNLGNIALDSLEQSPDDVVEFNRIQLKEQGIRPDGSQLKPYHPLTVQYKREKGQEYRWRTLQDTGAFQSRMSLVIKGNEFTITSSDPKTSEIIAREGDVFGLTSEHERKTWVEITRPYTIETIKRITGAK